MKEVYEKQIATPCCGSRRKINIEVIIDEDSIELNTLTDFVWCNKCGIFYNVSNPSVSLSERNIEK